MMRVAQIQNGVVANLWEVPALDSFPDLVPATEAVVIGATWDGNSFTNPPLPPDQQLIKSRREIRETLDATLDGGVLHAGVLWHADSVFQMQLTAFVAAFASGVLPAGSTVSVRDKDNVTHTLDEVAVRALALAVMAHVQAAYQASWAAKDALAGM